MCVLIRCSSAATAGAAAAAAIKQIPEVPHGLTAASSDEAQRGTRPNVHLCSYLFAQCVLSSAQFRKLFAMQGVLQRERN